MIHLRILQKCEKQRFMKKIILRKNVNPLCTASDFRGKGGLLRGSVAKEFNSASLEYFGVVGLC